MKIYYYALLMVFCSSMVFATVNIGAHNIYDNESIDYINVSLYGNGSINNFSGSTSNGTVNTYLVNGTPYNSSIVPFLYQTITRPIYGFINPSFEAFNSTNWLNYTLTNTAAYSLSASTSNVVLGTYSALLSDSFVGGSNSTATLTQQINVTEVKNITLNITAVTNKIGGSSVVCGGIEITLSMSGATSLRSVSSCDNTFDGSPVTSTDSAVLDTTGLNGTQTLTITIKENDAGANALQTFQVYAYLDALTVNYDLNATPIGGFIIQAINSYNLSNIQAFNATYNYTSEVQTTIGTPAGSSTCTNPGYAYDGNFSTKMSCTGAQALTLYQNFTYNTSWNNSYISWKTRSEASNFIYPGAELAIVNYTAGGFQAYKYYSGTYTEVDDYTYLSVNSLGLNSTNPLQVRLTKMGGGTWFNYSEGAVIVNATSANNFAETSNGYISIVLPNNTLGTGNFTIASTGYDTASYTDHNLSSNLTAVLDPYSLYLRFYDELNGSLVNYASVTAYLTGSTYSTSVTTSNGTAEIIAIPFDNYTITYSGSGYTQRLYNLNFTETQTLNLYLMNDSSDTIILATVFDTVGRRVDGAIIDMLKKNLSGTNYYSVETCRTNALGQCLLHVDLYDTTYQFVIYYLGEDVFNSNDTQVSQTAISFTIVTESTGLSSFYDISYFVGNLSYANATTTFSYSYTDTMSAFSQVCLRTVVRSGATNNQYTNVCSSNTSGTLSLSLNSSIGHEWTAQGYGVLSDGTEYQLDALSIVVDDFLPAFGREGLYLFGFFLLGAVMFTGLIHPIIPPVLGLVVVWVMNNLGFIGIGTTSVVSLIAIVIFLIGVNRRT